MNNPLQTIREALTAKIAENVSFLSDRELKALDKKITKARLAAGKYTAEEFKALPQRKKAVIIAQDVLSNIRLKAFAVRRETYLDVGRPLSEETCSLSTGSQEGKNALLDANCNVCAKGALFMSSVLRTNGITVGEFSEAWGGTMRKRLVDEEKVFDLKTFDTIEAAFEGNNFENDSATNWAHHYDGGKPGDYQYIYSNGDGHPIGIKMGVKGARALAYCKGFYRAFRNSTTRLAAIMVNIIENKGVFRPELIPGKKVVDAALKASVITSTIPKELK